MNAECGGFVCPRVSSPKLFDGFRWNLVLGSTLKASG